ncbi:MAG: hypothetical protein QM773_20910 [Hyphomonadaceae bacterium]
MTAQLSPATLAISAFAVAIAGFAGGVAITTGMARPADTAPIVDENAWNETAPAQPVSYAPTPQPRCNPWQISDAAMEEVLDEMVRRGWRAPTAGAAVALLESQAGALRAADPDAPMPARQVWSSATLDESADEPVDEDADETAPEPQHADAPKAAPPPV